jgi:hypothetical protein
MYLMAQDLTFSFALFYIYFPETYKQSGTDDNPRPSNEWKTSVKALKIVIVYTLLICVISVLVVLAFNVPSLVVTTWTAILAFIALISSLIQFIPQIMRTWKLKVPLVISMKRTRWLAL